MSNSTNVPPNIRSEKKENVAVITEALAVDCERVGTGPKGWISMAARVSLVNEHGQRIFDVYIKPKKPVTDYRTAVSGITPEHLANGRPLVEVKRELADFIRGRILVGHCIYRDLKLLGLSHPKCNTRDTAYYPPYQTKKGIPFPLEYLARTYLGLTITNGPLTSAQNAVIAMKLYLKEVEKWEDWLENRERGYQKVETYHHFKIPIQ